MATADNGPRICAMMKTFPDMKSPELSVQLPRGSTIMNVFFGKEQNQIKSLTGDNGGRFFPMIVFSVDPDLPEEEHRYAFVPLDMVVEYDPQDVWIPIGCYGRSDGRLMAVYQIHRRTTWGDHASPPDPHTDVKSFVDSLKPSDRIRPYKKDLP